MDTNEARNIVAKLGADLGGEYGQAVEILLDDYARLVGKRNARLGAREAAVLTYMRTVPGVPLSPQAVQVALGLDHSPAQAMANLAEKCQLQRLGKAALYRFTEPGSAAVDPIV